LLEYSWLRIEEGDKWYCWLCHQYKGAKDKLGTTKARPSRQEKLTEHAKNPSHIEVTRLHAAKLKKGQEADASTTLFEKEDPRDVVTFTAVASCVQRKISPLQHTAPVVSLLREHGVACRKEGRNSHLSSPSIREILIDGAEELRLSRARSGTFADPTWKVMMETLFPKRHGLGMPISFQADGSLDRGLKDKQAMLLSCIGKYGFKETYFLDLRELDMTKSKDGRSPDAAATAHCYVAALDELNESLGQFFPQGNWRNALVNFSFDNCSVNMGDKTGVGKQICDIVTQARCVGAVAHVLQLCVGDVDDIVYYFILFREIISQIIAQYQLSGKRKHALEELAQLLDGFVYKLRGIHGIRWVASMRNILAKVYKMLHIIVLDLDMRAKEKFGCASHTMHTADEMFMGVQFKPVGETRKYRVSGTVPTNDSSSMTLFKATALRGDQTCEISKVELLDLLGNCIEQHEVCTKCAAATYSSRCDKCKGKYLWDLKLKLQSRRFVLFLAFLIDMHALLERVSLIFQRDDLSIGDVGAEVNTAIDEIAKLAIACGKLESQVHNFVASRRGYWPRTALPLRVLPMTRMFRRTTQTGYTCASI
jgi:hypothetical protein